MELNHMTITDAVKFKSLTLPEKIEALDDYRDKADLFLQETSSSIEWELVGLSDRFNRGAKTLEYKYKLTRGTRVHSGLYNSSLNDLWTLLKFDKFKINDKSILAERIINDFDGQLRNKIKTIHISHEGKYLRFNRVDIPNPTSYDLLACLSVDDSSDIDDFCSNYGYSSDDTPISQIQAIYEAVKEQSNELKMLYSDIELEALQLIN
jgi:hypothetical protein